MQVVLCECGEFTEGHTFKNYIKTSSNPSTPTFGHCACGLIFDFVDGEMPKKYSSRKELKSIAMKFAEIKKMDSETTGYFLVEVERLKSEGSIPDGVIISRAFKMVIERHLENCGQR